MQSFAFALGPCLQLHIDELDQLVQILLGQDLLSQLIDDETLDFLLR